MAKKKKRSRRVVRHEIVRVWGWPNNDDLEDPDVRWSYACSCGRNEHEFGSKEAAREAADGHLLAVA